MVGSVLRWRDVRGGAEKAVLRFELGSRLQWVTCGKGYGTGLRSGTLV
jgi:hypothetical protein